MTKRKIKNRIKAVARFAEVGSDLEDDPHGKQLLEGANWLWNNADRMINSMTACADAVASLELLLRLSDVEAGYIEVDPRHLTQIIKRLRRVSI